MILFKSKQHKKYINFILNQSLQGSLDSSRVTLSYFLLSALDILKGLDIIEDRKQKYINWIYHFQSELDDVAGFQNCVAFTNNLNYKWGHIAATYSALNILLILGDDLSRVNKKSIIHSMKLLQLEDGSFKGAKAGAENDMRFIYCAASICYILDDWSGMDVDKSIDYILKSISYDGGIGQGPGLESHGGSTYCAIATLSLANKLNVLSPRQKKDLIFWILKRQNEGFQGRPNKLWDSCYTFWLGATMKILDSYSFINKTRLENFVLSTQNFSRGGFGKWVDYDSDPMHTYLALAGLSIMKNEEMNEIMPALNITYSSHQHLKKLHESWKKK